MYQAQPTHQKEVATVLLFHRLAGTVSQSLQPFHLGFRPTHFVRQLSSSSFRGTCAKTNVHTPGFWVGGSKTRDLEPKLARYSHPPPYLSTLLQLLVNQGFSSNISRCGVYQAQPTHQKEVATVLLFHRLAGTVSQSLQPFHLGFRPTHFVRQLSSSLDTVAQEL